MEELKGIDELLEKLKRKHAFLVKKVKGQHASLVEKVKELEAQKEENKHLTDHNLKLRTALVESHSLYSRHYRLIHPTDGDREEPGASNSAMSSSGQNSEKPSSIFTNAVVLDIVSEYLESEKLQECRLICREWNRIASSVLRKTNDGYGQAVYFSFNYWSNVIPDHELVRIRDLHPIVKTASEDWFKTVELDTKCLGRPEFVSVLKDFGNQLRFVYIRSYSLEINGLQKILVDWCPNLEKLQLFITSDFKGEASQLILPATNALKLSYLSLRIDADVCTPNIHRISEVLIKILKSSPNFKTLVFCGAHTSYCTPFFRRLQIHPHIMSNLETVFIPNPRPRNPQHRDPLAELSEIKFQSKLKRLVSTNITRKDGPALSRILNKMADSLEQLTLMSHETYNSRHLLVPCPADLKLKFSQMNNLQEFRYLIHREISIDSINFIVKMPNLKSFMLGFENPYLLGIEKNKPLDGLFSKCPELLVTPHINLKKLSLLGFIKNPCTTFGFISKCFPKLKKLGVTFPKMNPNSDPVDTYYEDFFKGVAELQNLNHLYLQWKDSLNDENKEFMEGFKHLKNVTELTHLTIRTGCGIEDFKDVLFESVPKLKRLTLVKITMSLAEGLKFRELMVQRNIFLEVNDDCYCESQFYSLEWDSFINDF